MKHMLLPFFSSICLSLFSQITVTDANFPSSGDTLRYARDGNPDLTGAITAPGGPQVWDFSNLEFDNQFETAYRPAVEGINANSFSGATLLTKTQQNETYYRKSSTKFESLGYAGADPANFGLNVNAKFQPPVVLRRAPMNFFDINQIETNLSLPFSIAELPDSLLPNIPFVDSIRFRINYKRLDVVDAYGKVTIPGGTYDVLREKRTEYTTTNLDIKSFLGWTPISGGGGGGGFLNFLGVDTTITHRFVSGVAKEDIAVLTLNNAGSVVLSAVFKNNLGTTSTLPEDAPGRASIQAYPNPAVESVSFFCYALPASEYTLRIFNIVGKTVWQTVEKMQGDKVISLDLEDFKKGPYLYSLTDDEGRVVATKRLMILKP